MGREIRRVPKGWEHPADERGHYKPLYDHDYEEKAQEWLKNSAEWEAGTHPDLVEDPELKHKYAHFWEWDGSPPEKEYYRPAWKPEEMTHYQMYETVSEGTPVSPVYETLEELERWLIGEGYSEKAASAFCKSGYAPSLVFSPQTGVMSGIEFMGLDSEA